MKVSEDDIYVLTKFQRIMRSANRQHEVEAIDRILAALGLISSNPGSRCSSPNDSKGEDR